MTTPREPRCSERKCKWLIGFFEGKYVCEAFPKGIPQDIAFGPSLHIVKRRGDRGITYS